MIQRLPIVKQVTHQIKRTSLNEIIKILYSLYQEKELHGFFYKKIFYKKMSLKNLKILRKCQENLQPQMPGLQFLKTLIFTRAL